jgi:hypothetical protein
MSRRVLLIGSGAFGEHVNRLLAARCEGAETANPGALDHTLRTRPDAVVVSAWRPDLALCEAVDGRSRRDGWCWLPVVLAHPYVRVGPWLHPARSPCCRCYRQWAARHDLQHGLSSALMVAYGRDAGCGPRGYLPHHARVAAGMAELALGRSSVGVGSTFHVLTGKTGINLVVACHGCARCRPPHRAGQPSRPHPSGIPASRNSGRGSRMAACCIAPPEAP